MTHLLPPSLLRLFAPRPPLEYVAPLTRTDPSPSNPPLPKDPSLISKRKRCRAPLSGVAATLERIKQDAADAGESTDDIASDAASSKYTLSRVTISEMAKEKVKSAKAEVKKRGLEEYDPGANPNATPDAYKTLFLSRLPYSTTEQDLHREFDLYGPISSIHLIRDKHSGKSRGYAFIAYERERDMKAAYKDAEGIKIGGRRIMVDVERGRTVKGWKPMRLGGGLGGSTRKEKKREAAAVEEPVVGMGFGGGFRGGRGGFRGGGFRGGGRGGGFGAGGAPRGGGGFGGPPRGFDNGFAPRGGGGGGGYSSSGPPRGGYGGGGGYGGPGARDRDYPGSSNNGSAGGGYAPRSYDDPNSGPPAKRSRY